MHYACLVITKEFPTEEVISKVVDPFNEESFYEKFSEENPAKESDYPAFLWDYWRVGGRYCGAIKLKVDTKNETPYDWEFYSREPRAGRLYRSEFVENQYHISRMVRSYLSFTEEDIYPYLGFGDGYLRVDGAKISDVLNLSDLGCHQFIDKDGKGYTRNWWNGKDFIPNPDFDKQLSAALADSADCYICYLDMHD